MSKTKLLMGGKTLSLWIPDEDWIDDFNHLLEKKVTNDRSVTRNSLFLQCVEKGLRTMEKSEEEEPDSIRIYLDVFPPEQANLLRTPAGRQLAVHLLSALISGQLGSSQPPTTREMEPWNVEVEPQPVEEKVRNLKPSYSEPLPSIRTVPEPVPIAKTTVMEEPTQNDKKIPDLFHTLLRNNHFNG